MNYLFKRATPVFFITAGIGIFSSCQKEAGNNDTCKIDMQHIAGDYKLTALTYKSNANGVEVNFFDFLNDCEKDDILGLHENGSFNFNDVGMVCSPNGSGSGTWSVNGNQLTSSDGNILEGTISTFDCKSLVYYANDLSTPGDKLTFTLTRQ